MDWLWTDVRWRGLRCIICNLIIWNPCSVCVVVVPSGISSVPRLIVLYVVSSFIDEWRRRSFIFMVSPTFRRGDLLCHAGRVFAEASEPSAAQGSGQTLGYSPLSRHHIAKRVIPFHTSFFALSLLTILSPSLVFFPPLDVGTSVSVSCKLQHTFSNKEQAEAGE